MGFCLQGANLKPWLVIVPGVYMQYWITSLIININDTKEEEKNELQLNLQENSSNKSCKSKCMYFMRQTLIIWQMVSVIGVLALDIKDSKIILINQMGHGS